MSQPMIMVVDDEAPTRKYVSANLRARDYGVLLAVDGTEALKLIAEYPIDLLLLDISLPGANGFEVLKAVRRDMQVPVIMLTARGREDDKVQALDLGADDYLTKPFGVEELLARVRAALRRAESSPKQLVPSYRHAEIEVDFSARQVTRGGAVVALTPKEYEVLAYMAWNAGKVLLHRQILEAVWGGQYSKEADYVWTYVCRLRSKLEANPNKPQTMLTHSGVGYSLAAPD
jgi:two-component system, OmpR family, KDP operon response regulator KdpE